MASRKPSSKNESEDWMSRIRESSHDVVLAGLASLTRAYGTDKKQAQADFKTLVAEGRQLGPELQETARKVWSEWVEKPRNIIGLRPEGRLQGVFDERVMSVLVRLGVPSGEEVAELRAKVDQLLAREGLASGPVAKGEKTGKAHARPAPKRRAAARPVDGRTGRRSRARG
jgi:poly(hydroxyalkanoate) granule-associated protein